MRRWSVVLAILTTVVAVSASTEPPITIYVDADAAPGGNGSPKSPFGNLPEAVAAARAASGFVTIKVEPGDYPLYDTLVIDRSIDLRGSTEQFLDPESMPTGDITPGTATRVFAANPAMTELIAIDRRDGSLLRTISVRGFVLEATSAGIAMQLTRVQGYWIADNVFRSPAQFGIQSIASSGRVSGNYFGGVGTGASFTGGYDESPGNIVFQGNRAVNNTTGGVALVGASLNIPEFGDELTAEVRDNDLSNNTGNQGFGVRAFIQRRDLDAPGSAQTAAAVYATIVGNRLVGNRIGIDVDAGFPYRRVGATCDGRVFSGMMNLRLGGNTVSGSILTNGLLTFTRNSAALNQSILGQWQYLHGAYFSIVDRDGILADAWIDNPANDPFLGPCPGDATHESLGNMLIYNGQPLYGRNF